MSQSLIANIGYRNALRTIGSMIFGLLCIAIILARPRYKPQPTSDRPWYRIIDTKLITFRFSLILVFCFFVPFGYVAAFFLTPSYAIKIGSSAATGSTLVSVMSAMNAVCRIMLGYLGDRYGRLNVLGICTLLSGRWYTIE